MKAVSFAYPEPAVRPLELLAWEYLPRMGVGAFKQAEMARMLGRARKACDDARLFVVIKGDQLPFAQYAELLDAVKCPKALWLMDSVHRVRDGLQRARAADVVFYFEGTDRPALADLSRHHHHVALAADPDWYRPIGGSRQLWDISFMGALYANRLSTLESVLMALSPRANLKGRFVGSYRSLIHPTRTAQMLKQYPLTAQHLVHGANWTHERINLLYNQSRICLNIFHPQSVDSVNPRTFEICCSGAFLLCQSNAALGRYFAIGREAEAFVTPEEAAIKIEYYLKNDAAVRRIATAGRERVLKEHTIKLRVEQMLATLKSDGLL